MSLTDLPKEALTARFAGPGKPFEFRAQRLPNLRDGEALLRVDCCTICGSDVRTIRGEREAPGSGLLGHEITGHLIATADSGPITDVEGKPLNAGDRVICGVAVSCGECRYCRREIPQKCERLLKFGHAGSGAGWELSGGLSDYCHLPRGATLVRVPESLRPREAAWIGCAGATAAAAIRTAGPLSGQTVLILGTGALGLFVAGMAASAGAEVLAVDFRKDRLGVARSLGVASCLQLRQGDDGALQDELIQTFAKDHTGGRGVDIVLETSGSRAVVGTALGTVDLGGRVILVGSVAPSDPVDFYPEKIVRGLIRIEGVHNYIPRDLKTATDFMSENPSVLASLGADFPVLGLREIDKAFELAQIGDHLRVAIEP